MRKFAYRPSLPALIACVAIVVLGFGGQRNVAELAAQRGGRSNTDSFAMTATERGHSFHFARAMYGGGGWGGGWGSSWATDWPEADQWITAVLRRLTGIDILTREFAVALDDPELRRYPFLYTLEVGNMALRDSEVQGLRDYLLAGGFLMVDDFHGTAQWRNWEREIRRVLPEYDIVEIPMDHALFRSFYLIDEIMAVPVVNRGVAGTPSWESDVHQVYCLGIFDENGRLMVVINWNTDIGDAWEHAEDPRYPLQYSTFAYQFAANLIVHAMTH